MRRRVRAEEGADRRKPWKNIVSSHRLTSMPISLELALGLYTVRILEITRSISYAGLRQLSPPR